VIYLKRLEEIAEIIMGTSPAGATYNYDCIGLPLLNGPTEFGNVYPESTLYTIDSKKECRTGDLIFCVRGNTTGRMNWANKEYSLGRGVCAIRGENIIDTKYIRYCLELYLPELLQLASGATMPNLTQSSIKQFSIPYSKYRDKVTSILSAYDNLIENNLRRIKILEEMAQNLYREWFVNFRFPGHENTRFVDSPLGKIPEGWRVENLFSIADVTYGYAFKSSLFNTDGLGKPVVRIRDVLSGVSKTFSTEEPNKKYLVENGDILIGMDGDFHMGFWVGGQAYLVQRVARFRAKKDIGTYLLFLSLIDPIKDFNSTITGTTVAHLGDKHLKTINFLLPDKEFLSYCNSILGSYLRLIISLKLKNQVLQKTRDLLLPKLISGEVDVSELDIKVPEEVAI